MTRSFDPARGQRGLFQALLDARAQFGGKRVVLEDQARQPMTYDDLIRASLAIGRQLANRTTRGEHVGLLLPSAAAAPVTFFGLHAFGRAPVMFNYTAGLRSLRSARQTAGVKLIVTSHRFIEQGKLHDVLDALSEGAEVLYLEDVRKALTPIDKARALADSLMAGRFATGKADDPGAILFTSGSFGAPRGVLLTQGNLVSNCEQIAAHIEIDPDWTMFSPLPVFHALGLTGGMLLPPLTGMRAFLYPSPLHARQIPPLIAQTKATILLSTDTFVTQYVRACGTEDLQSLKFVVCGAERVRDETHALLAGVELVEGYGATECSPVIAVNQPGHNRVGTVGRIVPGLEVRLEAQAGITTGQRLYVRGPNVMAGYIEEDGRLTPPEGGWHDTGDMVEIDADGYVTIRGRVKRFAKIGGEMVSLTVAEQLAAELWPGVRHACVALPDGKKGERLVLVTERPDADASALLAHAKAAGVSELAAPKRVIKVLELPVLGTGKTDYVAVGRIAEAEPEAAPRPAKPQPKPKPKPR